MAVKPEYLKGTKAKATLGGVKIKGLNSLTIPQPVRDTFTIEEFEEIDFEETSDLKWERGKMSGNYIKNDATGQAVLRAKLFADEPLTDLRLYEDETDFWAPDVAAKSFSCFKLVGITPPEVQKNAVVPFSCDILVQGNLARFGTHLTGSGIAFVAASGETPDTITDTGSGFLTAGFKAGQTVIVEGSDSNDGQYTVAGVAAGLLTLSSVGDLVDETAGESFTLHGGSMTV
jgi:bifunctional DNA-binding transcriptional regulator/antitoxin component of YhaV-PrlF toxin-antitoxin module